MQFDRFMKRGQRGASLLEVLIAILIMSFGLLALAGLTATSVQYGKMAQFQTIGVQLASDYVDRMRANADGFLLNAYNKTAVYAVSTAAATIPACAVSTACTAAETAAIDQAEWINSLRQRLPGGDAYVLRDTTNTLSVDIWIMWTEGAVAEGSDTRVLTGSNPDCPAAAVSGLGTVPRCVYFRATI